MSDDESRKDEVAEDQPGDDDLFGDDSAEDEEEQQKAKDEAEKREKLKSILGDDSESDEPRAAGSSEVNKGKKAIADDLDDSDAEAANANVAELFEDSEAKPVKEPRAQVSKPLEIPEIPCPKPNTKVSITRLPNFVTIESRPFDQDTYEEEALEHEYIDDDGNKKKSVRLRGNVIRWRKGPGGEDDIETNARVVRWEDGSAHLYIGKEAFQLQETNVVKEKMELFAFSSSALMGHGRVESKLMIKPLLKSETHKAMTGRMRQYYQHNKKVKMMVLTEEEEKRMKMAEQLEKEKDKISKRQRRAGDGGSGRDGLTTSFLEEGEDEETNVRALKSSVRGKKSGDDDDERESRLTEAKKRGGAGSSRQRASRRRDESEDEFDEDEEDDYDEDEEEEEEEESEEEERRSRKKRKSSKRDARAERRSSRDKRRQKQRIVDSDDSD